MNLPARNSPVVPDFFEGSPADISWYPPDNDEKGKKLGEFFNTKAAPPKTLERIPKVLKEIQSQRSGISEWGIVGYCWGGKIVNLISQEGTPFKAAASCHPAMVDANDAPGVTIPFAMLPSKDEPKEDVEKWQKAIKVKNIVEWWPNQVHGFMAARSDLKDPAVKSDYEKAYNLLLNFFHENMYVSSTVHCLLCVDFSDLIFQVIWLCHWLTTVTLQERRVVKTLSFPTVHREVLDT